MARHGQDPDRTVFVVVLLFLVAIAMLVFVVIAMGWAR